MLPSRSGRTRWGGSIRWFCLVYAVLGAAIAAEPEKAPAEKKTSPPLTNIPLPVGQEAKGLVLPDFDAQGHLRARFEAGKARRTDVEHLEFVDLTMTTFTPQNTTDLQILMTASVLDLNTRVLTSLARTTVHRSDFNIAGDKMDFDTVSRQGTLSGNVKMVITDQSDLRKKAVE